jgi:hypothetical protein
MPEKKEIKLHTKTSTNTTYIQELDLSELVEHAAILMIAKRGSGKSWIVRSLMHYYANKIPVSMVISSTDDVNPFYKQFMPDSYIHPKFDSDRIKLIFQRQQLIKEKSRVRVEKGKDPLNYKVLIVMDDTLADKSDWSKDPMINHLLFNGRHYGITYILTMQYSLGVTPNLRLNFDYVFLLADNAYSSQKKLFEQYAGIFPNFESFRQVFIQLTEDFGSMVIINRAKGQGLSEGVRYYKAPDLSREKISLGGGQYNKFHIDNYNKNWMKDNDPFEINQEAKYDRSRIKKTGLVVKKVKN